jgi:hypothetical protein
MNNFTSKPSVSFIIIKEHFEYNSTRIQDIYSKTERYPSFPVKPIYSGFRKYLLDLGYRPYSLSTPYSEVEKYAGKNDREYLKNIIENYANIRLTGGFVKCLNSNTVIKVEGNLSFSYGEVLSHSVVNIGNIKNENYYRLHNGTLRFCDDNDIDLVNNFNIKNELDNNNYITTSFYLAIKYRPGLIAEKQLGNYTISRNDNIKCKFHIDLSYLIEKEHCIESIYYFKSDEVELKADNQSIEEMEPLFQHIKVNRLYCDN